MGSSWLCVYLTSGLACRSEDDWIIIPLITANVLLSPSLATQAVGGAVELKKTQTTIHQLMDSSYTAGWEGCDWERERERRSDGGREAREGKPSKSESEAAWWIFYSWLCQDFYNHGGDFLCVWFSSLYCQRRDTIITQLGKFVVTICSVSWNKATFGRIHRKLQFFSRNMLATNNPRLIDFIFICSKTVLGGYSFPAYDAHELHHDQTKQVKL